MSVKLPISNYYKFNLQVTQYMGCVTTQDPRNNQKKPQQNIPPSTKISAQPTLTAGQNHPNPKHHHINDSIIDADVHVNVPTETNQHQIQLNKSPRPEWNVDQVQTDPRTNINQSEVNVIFSSDAKEHQSSLNAATHSNYLQSNIQPITEVPSALEVDSKKYSLPANSNDIPKKDKQQPHKPDHHKVIDKVVQSEQKVKEEKLVELENIQEILSSGHRSPHSIPRHTPRIHGEENIFTNYQQNFEIPFCYVALTAQT